MSTTISIPPPPNGQVLSLVSALSQTDNHELHVQAIQARDQALSSGPDSYGNLCLQLAFLTVGSDQPDLLLSRIDPSDMQMWQATDGNTAARIQSNPSMWIPFGQMAGLILKNALLRPPIHEATGRPMTLETGVAEHVKETLLYGLSLAHGELRNVISSVIADCSVSADGVQPYLHTSQWPKLMPTIIQNLEPNANPNALKGSLSTIRKMMEDDPEEIPTASLDMVVYLLLQLFQSPDEHSRLESLQSLVACLAFGLVPSSLVLHFSAYLDGLSRLATDPSPAVRKWVCRSINTLLEHHAQYIEPHLESICQFMLQSTTQHRQHHQDDNIDVATEACEFWLIFATLHEEIMTSSMLETVERIIPHLVPTLLNNMVYSREQQIDLVAQNEIDDQEESNPSQAMKPVFHRTKNKHDGSRDENKHDDNAGDDEDEDDDGNDFDDDDNEWNLRKYAGASLDSLSNLYGAGPILPSLLPSVQHGLSNSDPWIQEASILALGAIADGCQDEMYAHMSQLYPYLMNLLLKPESPENLPQVKCICAWTSSRYAGWAVNEVQEGSQGHLLAQTSEVYLQRLHDKNRKVQIACGSALGVLMEAAGDLMVPYLHQIYIELASAISRFQGRSLIIIMDAIGIMAEYCGPATGEHNLPGIYVPPLMALWNTILRQDPRNRMLLPLMETLANVALVCGMNYQPFALETFENAMGIIEQVQLVLATTDDFADEEADPIICATDLLDGLCEGLGPSFAALVLSSSRFGQHFTSVLHALCVHQVVGIRVSAFALLGDLARKAPTMIELALPQLLQDAMGNLETSAVDDEMHSSLWNNVVWSIGEICVQCGEHSAPLEPYAAPLMQQLIALLMGNGMDRVTSIPGLAENAAVCVGRLANVNPMFVAPELSRFLLGWCDGLARILDLRERRDALNGLCNALYANPQVIQSMGVPVPDVVSTILFSITSWHVSSFFPDSTQDLLSGEYALEPFPPMEAAVRLRLAQLIKDIRSSVGEESWKVVNDRLPVNVRRLFREVYQI